MPSFLYCLQDTFRLRLSARAFCLSVEFKNKNAAGGFLRGFDADRKYHNSPNSITHNLTFLKQEMYVLMRDEYGNMVTIYTLW